MRYAIVTLLPAAVAMILAGGACSDKETGSSSGSTSGGVDAAGGGEAASEAGGGDAGVDAAPLVVNNCKTFDDRTAAGATRTIAWQFPIQAADRCIRIKKGQSVTWNGNFTQYPVIASSGSTEPNPIRDFDDTSPTVTFPKVGTYGFESDAPALQGAIDVVE